MGDRSVLEVLNVLEEGVGVGKDAADGVVNLDDLIQWA